MAPPPIVHMHGFLDGVAVGHCFMALQTELAWRREPGARRSEYYCNLTPGALFRYGHGRGERVYAPQPWHPVLKRLQEVVSALSKANLDSVFCNFYQGSGDQIGWHADDSPSMCPHRPIAIVSFGAPATLRFRERCDVKFEEDRRAIYPVQFLHGDVLVMPAGMQSTWEHRVSRDPVDMGPRISLVFRGYVERK